MARPRPVADVLLVVAAFSRHPAALDWARARLEEAHGPIALASAPYAFDMTRYYEASMGSDLRKALWAFRDLVDPARLPDLKLAANALEEELAGLGLYPEARPVNLDPGYLVLGKFVLATTKDQAHRLYLRDGIFAEVTLHYQSGAYHPWPWTYADYRLDEVIAFLGSAREYYREAIGRQRAASREEATDG
jgi:hypothetical protein